jgi:hypothetical protein
MRIIAIWIQCMAEQKIFNNIMNLFLTKEPDYYLAGLTLQLMWTGWKHWRAFNIILTHAISNLAWSRLYRESGQTRPQALTTPSEQNKISLVTHSDL